MAAASAVGCRSIDQSHNETIIQMNQKRRRSLPPREKRRSKREEEDERGLFVPPQFNGEKILRRTKGYVVWRRSPGCVFWGERICVPSHAGRDCKIISLIRANLWPAF